MKLLLALLLLLLSIPAHAGLFKKICEKLIMENPYQYEELDSEIIHDEIKRLQIKERWKTISVQEQSTLNILRAEMHRRTPRWYMPLE